MSASKPVIPPAPEVPGWEHVSSGKVRDVYRPAAGGDWEGKDVLLVVASDRISAYDHILSTEIPDKGKVLTALSAWWFEQLADVVPNHLVSMDVPEQVAGRAMSAQLTRMNTTASNLANVGNSAGSAEAAYRTLKPVFRTSFDAATGLCCGCGRTRDEIAAWGSLSEAQRRAVMAGLEARMRAARCPGVSTGVRVMLGCESPSAQNT